MAAAASPAPAPTLASPSQLAAARANWRRRASAVAPHPDFFSLLGAAAAPDDEAPTLQARVSRGGGGGAPRASATIDESSPPPAPLRTGGGSPSGSASDGDAKRASVLEFAPALDFWAEDPLVKTRTPSPLVALGEGPDDAEPHARAPDRELSPPQSPRSPPAPPSPAPAPQAPVPPPLPSPPPPPPDAAAAPSAAATVEPAPPAAALPSPPLPTPGLEAESKRQGRRVRFAQPEEEAEAHVPHTPRTRSAPASRRRSPAPAALAAAAPSPRVKEIMARGAREREQVLHMFLEETAVRDGSARVHSTGGAQARPAPQTPEPGARRGKLLRRLATSLVEAAAGSPEEREELVATVEAWWSSARFDSPRKRARSPLRDGADEPASKAVRTEREAWPILDVLRNNASWQRLAATPRKPVGQRLAVLAWGREASEAAC